jgi:hypothetical protein
MSVLDLVMSCCGFEHPRRAAEWCAQNFPVDELTPRIQRNTRRENPRVDLLEQCDTSWFRELPASAKGAFVLLHVLVARIGPRFVMSAESLAYEFGTCKDVALACMERFRTAGCVDIKGGVVNRKRRKCNEYTVNWLDARFQNELAKESENTLTPDLSTIVQKKRACQTSTGTPSGFSDAQGLAGTSSGFSDAGVDFNFGFNSA